MIRRGFTLLELVLVLAILAVVATLAIPALGRFGRGRALEETAARLLTLTRGARSRAISEGTAYEICLDLKNHKAWCHVAPDDDEDDDAGDAPPAPGTKTASRTETAAPLSDEEEEDDDLFGEFQWPAEIEIKIEDLDDSDDVVTIRFEPEGTQEPGLLRVTNAEGHVMELISRDPADPYHVAEMPVAK